MNAIYHAVLVVLLALPDSVLDEYIPPEALPVLKRLAIEWDLADEWTSWNAANMPHEITWTRNALREAKGAPPSWHASLLPTHDHCRAQVEASWAFAAALERWQKQSEYAEQMGAPVMDEARRRQRIWKLARAATDAGRSCAFPYQRRGQLRDLLEEIGPADFCAGRLPPPVPVEMLRRRD